LRTSLLNGIKEDPLIVKEYLTVIVIKITRATRLSNIVRQLKNILAI